MNRAILKKCLTEVRLLFAACAVCLFLFCWVRMFIVSRIPSQSFAAIIEQLLGALGDMKDILPVPLSQFLSYSGRVALTYDEPVVVFSLSIFAIARGSDAISGELNRGKLGRLLVACRKQFAILHIQEYELGTDACESEPVAGRNHQVLWVKLFTFK